MLAGLTKTGTSYPTALLTWYPGDGDLPAAVAVAALSEGFDLDNVVLVGGQRQLDRGGVGLHDAGVAVPILLVQHLQGAEEEKEHLGVRHCSQGVELDLKTNSFHMSIGIRLILV